MTLGSGAARCFAVDSRIVNDGIHAADRVDLLRDAAGLDGIAQIPNNDASSMRRQVIKRRGPLL